MNFHIETLNGGGLKTGYPYLVLHPSQGAQTAVDLPQKSPDSKTCIFWCKTTWGTMFTKGTLPLMGESM